MFTAPSATSKASMQWISALLAALNWSWTSVGPVNRFHRWYCGTAHWRRTVQRQIVPWVLDGVVLGPEVLEVGPGPGLTTDILAGEAGRVTAVEIDPGLAEKLRTRMAGTNVVVRTADATRLPFDDETFSAAVCFTMLHHLPSPALQDRLLAEVFRVLRPGAMFAGSDSTSSVVFRAAHLFDTMVLVDPGGFAARLRAAGFADVQVDLGKAAFKFQGWKR
jgi:SAM-dependent methyltransferase